LEKSLFEITADLKNIIVQLEDGECTEELEQALMISHQELKIKGNRYIFAIENLKYDIAKAKALEEQAKVYRTRKEKVIEKLENSLLDAVKMFGKFEAGVYTVSTRKSESVIIENLDKLPNSYKVVKISEQPDKAKIKTAIKNGEEVPGATIQETTNLSIR
jgi:hypothetical protein